MHVKSLMLISKVPLYQIWFNIHTVNRRIMQFWLYLISKQQNTIAVILDNHHEGMDTVSIHIQTCNVLQCILETCKSCHILKDYLYFAANLNTNYIMIYCGCLYQSLTWKYEKAHRLLRPCLPSSLKDKRALWLQQVSLHLIPEK